MEKRICVEADWVCRCRDGIAESVMPEKPLDWLCIDNRQSREAVHRGDIMMLWTVDDIIR